MARVGGRGLGRVRGLPRTDGVGGSGWTVGMLLVVNAFWRDR